MAEALTSPYGVGPSALPANTSSPQDQFINQLSQVRIPQMEGEPSRVPANEPLPVEPPQSPDALLSKTAPEEVNFFDPAAGQVDFFAPDAAKDAVPTAEKPTFEAMSSELGPVEATKRYVGDSLARAKLSFATNDWEKQATLKQMYGEENVRMKDGELQFRRKGDKGFRALDPKQAEYIDDALDFARTATEIGAEGAIRGGITYAGARAGGVKGAVAGAMLSGAAGAAGATTVGDFIAQGVLGIPKDPARSAGKELATSATLGALFSGAGAKFVAWRAAKNAAKGSEATAQTALKTAQELEQISDNLLDNGITLKQGKITLSPGQQASRYLPEAQSLDVHLGSEEPVRKFFDEQGRMFLTGWEDLTRGISNATGKNADELFVKVKESAKLSTQLEGKMIEGFRDQALAKSKRQPRDLPNASQVINDYMFGPDGLGFRQVVGRDALTFKPNMTIHSPKLDDMRKIFPGADEFTMIELKNDLLEPMANDMRKTAGKMSLATMDKHYTKMRKFIDRNIGVTANSNMAKSLIHVKNALRDDWTTAIGQELQDTAPQALGAYTSSMEKYSALKTAQDTLSAVLKKNDLSAAAFANTLFAPATGKDKVRQMKVLINENTPELWDELKGTYLNTLTEQHSKLVKGRGADLERIVDWNGLNKKIDQLDRAEILDQMFDKKSTFNKQQVKDFFTLAGRIDNSVRLDENALQSAGVLQKMRQFITVVMPGTSSTAKIANISTLIGSMGKDKAVARWLDGEGLELVLKGLPKPKQHEARVLLTAAVKQALYTQTRIGVGSVLRKDTPPEEEM